MTRREKELREMFLDAHDQLLRRDEEIQATLAVALRQKAPVADGSGTTGPVITGAIATTKSSIPSSYLSYHYLIHQIQETVRGKLPHGAKVLVVSKGDAELLRLEGRTGWHFPQNEQGVYAGYNPADAAAAVAHLEELRARGADFLLIPATALWWLDHYAEFRRHLENHYQTLVHQQDTCVIFSLRKDQGAHGSHR